MLVYGGLTNFPHYLSRYADFILILFFAKKSSENIQIYQQIFSNLLLSTYIASTHRVAREKRQEILDKLDLLSKKSFKEYATPNPVISRVLGSIANMVNIINKLFLNYHVGVLSSASEYFVIDYP